MSRWKRIPAPDDPDWEEYHKEVFTQKGRCMLKLWFGGAGWGASLTNLKGQRLVNYFRDAETSEEAKKQADKWSMNLANNEE